MSKLTLESSVRASMLMVRQASLSEALVCCWMMDMAAVGCVLSPPPFCSVSGGVFGWYRGRSAGVGLSVGVGALLELRGKARCCCVRHHRMAGTRLRLGVGKLWEMGLPWTYIVVLVQ